MAIQFGNTWWGKKWVDSIEDTEYENRLPRGKSYARNGSVIHIEINDDQAFAHVRGSRRTPYHVRISLKPFTEKQKQTILKIITDNPLYLSELLIRNLPEKLYEECASAGINLFPSRWRDFKANCSCPDWAPCCKHIASVIYLIANEIDRNPFLAFSLHGMDVFSELQKLGYTAQESHKTKILSPDALWEKQGKNKKDWQFDKTIFEKIDFSIIPESGAKLIGLLSDNPVFPTKKNFKQTLDHAYKEFARKAKYFNLRGEDIEKAENTELFVENIIEINKKLKLKQLSLKSPEEEIALGHKKTLIDIIEFCQNIPAKSAAFHEPKLRSLILLVRFVLKVMESGAFLPELLEIEKEKKYRIRWVPALVVPEVKKVFDQIAQVIPLDFLNLASKKKESLSKEQQIKTAFSFLFGALIQHFLKHENLHRNDPIPEIFFREMELDATSFETKEVPESIALWLSRFSIFHKDYAPLIKIDESKKGFLLDLCVEDRKHQLREPIPFKKIVNYPVHRISTRFRFATASFRAKAQGVKC